MRSFDALPASIDYNHRNSGGSTQTLSSAGSEIKSPASNDKVANSGLEKRHKIIACEERKILKKIEGATNTLQSLQLHTRSSGDQQSMRKIKHITQEIESAEKQLMNVVARREQLESKLARTD